MTLTVIEANSAYVYVIENAATGALKVGISADPVGRARGLQYQYRQSHRLLAASVGAGEWVGYRLERGVHALLSQDRQGGEWFSQSPRMQRLLAAFGGVLDTAGLSAHDATILTAIYQGRDYAADTEPAPPVMPADGTAYWGEWAALL